MSEIVLGEPYRVLAPPTAHFPFLRRRRRFASRSAVGCRRHGRRVRRVLVVLVVSTSGDDLLGVGHLGLRFVARLMPDDLNRIKGVVILIEHSTDSRFKLLNRVARCSEQKYAFSEIKICSNMLLYFKYIKVLLSGENEAKRMA